MICIIFAKSLSTFLHVTVRWYLHNLQSLFVLKLLLFLCTPTSRSITLIWGCAWGLGWVCVYSWEIFVLFGVFCWWDVVRSILWNIFQLSPFPYVTRPFHQLPSRYFSLNNHPGWLSVFTLESKCFHGDTYFFLTNHMITYITHLNEVLELIRRLPHFPGNLGKHKTHRIYHTRGTRSDPSVQISSYWS